MFNKECSFKGQCSICPALHYIFDTLDSHTCNSVQYQEMNLKMVTYYCWHLVQYFSYY